MNKPYVSIGCASGFWGDTPLAVSQLLRETDLDYIVFDYLSEVTLTILAKLKKRDPEKGFVPDFLSDVIEPHLETIVSRKIKLVANAGALNSLALKKEIEKIAAAKNVSVKVFCITGDDLIGHPKIPQGYISANAYLGASAITEALDLGAEIVITGRVVDTAVVVGPIMHEIDFKWYDYDHLAQASLAGHIIECGTQCTGGNFTDWEKIPKKDDVGFPIVHFYDNGDFTVQKVSGTGGMVSIGTVSEQIVYEIGDPAHYILPDVICDFSQVGLTQKAPDVVLVQGAKGKAPTNTYKVAATKMDGWKISTTAFIGGFDARKKSQSIGEAILTRCERILKDKGILNYKETLIETLGSSEECLLRISATHASDAALEVLAKEIAPGALSLAPGMTNLLGGRASPQPRIAFESFLFSKDDLNTTIHGENGHIKEKISPTPVSQIHRKKQSKSFSQEMVTVKLRDVIFARSGDKGDDANIGIIARKEEQYGYLKNALTPKLVGDFFGVKDVSSWELPGICALNFLLKHALGGGGSYGLRIDPQGKAYAQRLLEMEIPFPKDLL